jgi:hypothetical protein
MSAHDPSHGKVVGPRVASAWKKWREARDRAIASPRRLKTCKDKERRQ